MLFLQPLWEPALMMLPLVILLFPDGRLPSRRWRLVLSAYAALVAVFLAAAYSRTATAIAGHRIRVDSGGDLLTAAHGGVWVGRAAGVGFGLLAACALSFVGRQLLSLRRSSGQRRQQLKWLVAGGAFSIVAVAVSAAVGNGSELAQVVSGILGFGLVAMPVAIGVGILRYRLYEIDRIISRTLAYAIVTGCLIGVYAGLVLLATRVLSLHTPVAVAAATLAAAALFNPLRRRVQHAVDRRFNRARYDADQTAAAFAARLKDAVDLDSIRDGLAGVVCQTLEPSHVSVWVSRGD